MSQHVRCTKCATVKVHNKIQFSLHLLDNSVTQCPFYQLPQTVNMFHIQPQCPGTQVSGMCVGQL